MLLYLNCQINFNLIDSAIELNSQISAKNMFYIYREASSPPLIVEYVINRHAIAGVNAAGPSDQRAEGKKGPRERERTVQRGKGGGTAREEMRRAG